MYIEPKVTSEEVLCFTKAYDFDFNAHLASSETSERGQKLWNKLKELPSREGLDIPKALRTENKVNAFVLKQWHKQCKKAVIVSDVMKSSAFLSRLQLFLSPVDLAHLFATSHFKDQPALIQGRRSYLEDTLSSVFHEGLSEKEILPLEMTTREQSWRDKADQTLKNKIYCRSGQGYRADLSKCELRVMPPSIKDYPSLYYLNVSENRLITGFSLPPFRSLNFLDLSYNKLSCLVLEDVFPALEYLYLEGNGLVKVTLPVLKKLRVLNLAKNRLAKITLPELPELHSLYLNNNLLPMPPLLDTPKLQICYLAENPYMS